MLGGRGGRAVSPRERRLPGSVYSGRVRSRVAPLLLQCVKSVREKGAHRIGTGRVAPRRFATQPLRIGVYPNENVRRRRKVENHEAAVALKFMWYNFARVHQTLRVTPAMEARIADHLWTIEEILALLD